MAISPVRPVRPPIERASPADLLALASDLPGSPAVVAAIIMLGAGTIDLASTRAALAERIVSIPRLRQRLVPTPFGCGRQVWIDDDQFDIADHVNMVACPLPQDESALLDLAAACVTRRLPSNRPLWSAHLVLGLSDNRTALIFVFHHVLADGIGGLAILARLIDGAPPTPGRAVARSRPTRSELLADALGERLRVIGSGGAHVRRLLAAARELAPNGIVRPPRSSLNRPTGSSRRLAVARVDLALVQGFAHAHGATVNDVVLTAVTGALHTLLSYRNEHTDRVVVSVPVSRRQATSATELGNEVGAIPMELPCTGDQLHRLEVITQATRHAKTSAPGSSAALLGPVFRVLAALGMLRWFLDRQHLITTFVTNVRGPAMQLRLLGAPIIGMIPVSPITGNVTVAFAALSYAGTLTVTVIADPERCPDLPLLVKALQRELDSVSVGGVAAAS
jgi:diacylglycerol O-acyltransferase